MNANELAIELERHCTGKVGCEYLDQAATMLRQLQNDNKELHAIAQRMAMAESDARKSLQNYKDYSVKELTDEEIDELAREMGMHLYDYEIDPLGNCLDFAKAILRKAQEK